MSTWNDAQNMVNHVINIAYKKQGYPSDWKTVAHSFLELVHLGFLVETMSEPKKIATDKDFHDLVNLQVTVNQRTATDPLDLKSKDFLNLARPFVALARDKFSIKGDEADLTSADRTIWQAALA